MSLSKLKAFIAKRFTLVEFVVGGQNLGAGTTSVSNAFSNYLCYREVTLRLMSVCIILAFLGSAIAILEAFPQPDLVDRHANFLNTYFGRAVLYMIIALISADSIQVTGDHKWYMYMTWLSAGSLAGTSVLFFVLGFVNAFWKPLPVSRSMTTREAAGTKTLPSDSSDPMSMSNKAGWTINDENDDSKSVQIHVVPNLPPYGDPFDQASVDQSGWKHESTLDYTGQKLPAPLISGGGSTYSVDMSGFSYVHQLGTADSRLQWTKSSDCPSSLDDYEQGSSHSKIKGDKSYTRPHETSTNPFRRMKYSREASSSQDHLLPTLGYGQHGSRGDNQIVFTQDPNRREQCYSNKEKKFSDKHPSHRSKRRPSRKDHHKRVFVPGIGSFDLSSGSESEGLGGGTVQQDDDDDSVYSLDSDLDVSRPETEAPARMGRKLTRKETRTYRGKLNRGMQRAMSQGNRLTGDKAGMS